MCLDTAEMFLYTAQMQINCICILGYSRFEFWLYTAQSQTQSETKRDHRCYLWNDVCSNLM